MAPVFFVLKKDGKKRMVQDYHYINEWTVKNAYPLLLISELIDNVTTKRVFTKMDLQWGYIIVLGLRKEMSGRQHSPHSKGCTNQ